MAKSSDTQSKGLLSEKFDPTLLLTGELKNKESRKHLDEDNKRKKKRRKYS